MKEELGNFEIIHETANNIILKNKDLKKLRTLCNNFFKKKTQKEIDLFKKEEINAITNTIGLIKNKNRLNEADQAKIDYWFNKPMKKYLSLEISKKISDEELKKLTYVIYEEDKFANKKQKEEFMSFMAWIWTHEGSEDYEVINKEKDLLISLYFSNNWDNEKEKMISLLVLCTKNQYRIIERINGAWKK